MANTNELMDFVKSLNNRGLLSKTIDEFDYEWVIWDYERSKVKNLSSNPMLSDSSASPCEHRYSRTMAQPYPRRCAFNITCQSCGKDCQVYEQVNTAQIGEELEWWCYCQECDIETFHPC